MLKITCTYFETKRQKITAMLVYTCTYPVYICFGHTYILSNKIGGHSVQCFYDKSIFQVIFFPGIFVENTIFVNRLFKSANISTVLELLMSKYTSLNLMLLII